MIAPILDKATIIKNSLTPNGTISRYEPNEGIKITATTKTNELKTAKINHLFLNRPTLTAG